MRANETMSGFGASGSFWPKVIAANQRDQLRILSRLGRSNSTTSQLQGAVSELGSQMRRLLVTNITWRFDPTAVLVSGLNPSRREINGVIRPLSSEE